MIVQNCHVESLKLELMLVCFFSSSLWTVLRDSFNLVSLLGTPLEVWNRRKLGHSEMVIEVSVTDTD